MTAMRKIALLVVLVAYVLLCRTSDSVLYASRRMLYQKTDGNLSCLLVMDYPVFDNALGKSIRTYLNKQLGDTFAGDRSQTDSLTVYYGDKKLADMKRTVSAHRLAAPADTCFYRDIRLMKTAEDSVYVYYTLRECTNVTPNRYEVSRHKVCFRKKDGQLMPLPVKASGASSC
jgi:hypothetical protein